MSTAAIPRSGEGVAPSLAYPIPAARRIASWLFLLAGLVIVLILWGGLVRLSGSGLSIPEWPLINGSLLPPFSDDGWETVHQTYATRYPSDAANLSLSQFQRMFAVEYFHRFLAALVGIVFLAILVRSKRLNAVWPKVKMRLLIGAGVLIAQAVLGGIVVKFDLKAEMVAVHLGTAFVFFALLTWTAMSLTRDGEAPDVGRMPLRRIAWMASGAALLQIISGGLVAGSKAGLIANTWPKMESYWIPPLRLLWDSFYTPSILNLFQNQILIQFVHRWLAFIAAGAAFYLIARGMSVPMSPRGRIAMRAISSVVVLQILLGVGNLLLKTPFWLAWAHLATGLALFAVLIMVTHEIAYAPDATNR